MSSRLVRFLLVALPLSSMAGTSAQSAPRQFVSPLSTILRGEVLDVAGGDLDRDGKPDLVVSINGGFAKGPYLEWFKGNGDGTFTEKPIPNAVAMIPQYVLLADLNGDGIPDLITASDGTSVLLGGGGGYLSAAELDVYLGNGDGTFQNPQRYLQKVAVSSPVVVDLRGKGRPDLAVLAGGHLQIMNNNGDGTFATGQNIAFTRMTQFDRLLGAADFNRDGRQDLVIRNEAGFLVLTGNGNGTVSPGPSFPLLYSSLPLSFSPHPAQIVDLNHDGRPDIVVADLRGATVLLGNGDGTFHDTGDAEKALRFALPDEYVEQPSVEIVDLNHDGNKDFIVGQYSYLGKGDGTFHLSKIYSFSASIEIGLDVNGDGNTDLVSIDQNTQAGPALNVALGTTGGIFQGPTESTATWSMPIVSGDFNGDGIMDVATPCQQAQALCVMLGTGKGYFGSPNAYRMPYLPSTNNPGGLAIGDVNGDGFLDLVVVLGSASVLLGKGDGTFGAPVTSHLNGSGTDALLVDMNKDGKLDLVGQWGVALGNGDGTFQPAKPLPADIEFTGTIIVGDFNNDGFMDLATPALDVATGIFGIHILLGDGSGSFPKDSVYLDRGRLQGALTATDVNKDGILDLLYTSRQPDYTMNLSVAFGKGDGTFGTPVTYPFPNTYCCDSYYPGVIGTADFNLDGNMDAFFTTVNHIEYFRGLPGGKFAPGEEYLLGNSVYPSSNTSQYAILDLNGDSFPDIVATDRYLGIMRLLNTGAVAPSSPAAVKPKPLQ